MAFERVYAVKYGDIFHTTDVDKDVKPGQQYKNYPAINEDLGISFGRRKRLRA